MKDDWEYPLSDLWKYSRKMLTIYSRKIWFWFNRHLLKTYMSIEYCARCEDCGRNVHDFHVPDPLWLKVYGSLAGVLCYDCFRNRADRKELGLHGLQAVITFDPQPEAMKQ